jgi:hypothetical protein
MRRTLLPLLSIGLLLGLTAGSRAADDDPKAVLAKAIKAHGGEEALTKYKATQSKTKGKLFNLPVIGEAEFTQEAASMLPDKAKETMTLDVGGQKVNVVTIMNGDTFSIESAGMDVPITDDIKKALKGAQYMMKVARLVSLVKDKDYELSALGEVKVEDKPAVGVQVKSKGHNDISLFFYKDTGLLAKLEHRSVEASSGKEITEERIVVKYGDKTKEGIALPKEVLVKHDGQTFMKAEVLESKVLEKLDDSEFKK